MRITSETSLVGAIVANKCYILKKKSLASQISIFITDIRVEMKTTLLRLFCSKRGNNLIQYQMLQNFTLRVLKCFFQKDKMSMFEHSPRASETVPDSFGGHSRTRESSQMLYKTGLLYEM